MKSNEEFLKGVWEKAACIQEQEKVIPIRQKRKSTAQIIRYAAGMAACFLCGIVMTKEFTGNRPQENVQKSNQRSTEPMNASIEMITLPLDCVIEDVKMEEGIASFNVRILNIREDDKNSGTVYVTTEQVDDWMVKGKEVLFSVYDPGDGNVYTQVPDIEVFLYKQTTEKGKQFVSLSGKEKFLDENTIK